MDWYVYMLRCEDGSLYTGIASDVEKRFAMHKSGHGAKYTRSHPPVAVVYREQCSDQGRGAAARGRHQEATAREKTRTDGGKLRCVKRSSTARMPRRSCRPRKEDGHKGDFGKLLVLGGSVGYTGAPYLAASAAVHSGCGLVYLGVPESIWAVEAQKCVSAMSFPLPETDGRLCLAALDKMQDKLKGCDVLALGPGLGRGKETEQLVHALLWQVKSRWCWTPTV